jgi:hypothetical protein
MTADLHDLADTGPFTFRWPDGTESFERGWTGTVTHAGASHRFQYGIAERTVYGAPRTHSVVWLEGQPIAEGVATDDHERSQCLVSRIKGSDRRVVRRREDLPAGLEDFTVVEHREEIDAPHSPSCLAVKIAEDDVQGWVGFALWRRDIRQDPDISVESSVVPPAPVDALTESPDDDSARLGPSLGMTVIRELEDGLPLEVFAEHLRLYEQATGYDVSLERLRGKTSSGLDPLIDEHAGLLLEWLRAWGCRHLSRASEVESREAIRTWASRWHDRLPGQGRHLVDLDRQELLDGATAYGELAAAAAAFRARKAGPVAVHFGPTAGAKALYAIRPNAFLPWDDPIRVALGLGGKRRRLPAVPRARRGSTASIGGASRLRRARSPHQTGPAHLQPGQARGRVPLDPDQSRRPPRRLSLSLSSGRRH